MSASESCLNARASFETIRTLKRNFDLAFDQAVSSGKAEDVDRAKSLKQQLETEMKALQEKLAIVEVERLFDLKKQYEGQLDLLKSSGMVETRKETDPPGVERETFFITGIDEKEYPIPPYLTILERFAEKKQLLEIKEDQGFKKLVLVPFGMSLAAMSIRFEQFLSEYLKIRPEFASIHPDQSLLDDWERLYKTRHKDVAADKVGTLKYDPVRLVVNNKNPWELAWKTKQEILDQAKQNQDTAPGWSILLLQAGLDEKGFRSIPRAGSGIVDGTKMPRAEIEVGRSTEDYLISQMENSNDSPYAGEYGLTPEAWLVIFMEHLKETDRPLDSYNGFDKGTVDFLIGSLLDGFYVTAVGWTDRHSIFASTFGLANFNSCCGIRTAVRV